MNEAAGEERAPVATESVTPGQLLRRERVRRSLSLQQTAEELHLDAWIVEALETDRFTALGAPVYAKGYLRKYALLLNLPPEVVIARYETLSDRPAVPTPIPVSVQTPAAIERASLKKPLLIVAGVCSAALAWWAVAALWSVETAPPQTALSDGSIGAPAIANIADESEPPPVQATERPSVESPPHVPQAPPESGQSSAPAPLGPQVRLRLEFSETSWAEVYDAGGRRLMFALGEPGRARTLVGVAPLQVTLGAASAVTAHVNDQPIVIPRREGRDASRFIVDDAGRVLQGGAR